MKVRHVISALIVIIISSNVMANPKKNSLKSYRAKRDFSITPEPKGQKRKKSKSPIFVIQKHDASHLHYDFRLEIDGVLKSWSIPKGPSLNPTIKRLAILTEDHPLEYADFEGIIPQGEYGAGTVMVWDFGTYKNIKEKDGKTVPMQQCFEQGTIEVWLEGKKLHGGFALVRTHSSYAKDGWLLIKLKDEYASAKRNPISMQHRSALTERTMSQIAREEKAG